MTKLYRTLVLTGVAAAACVASATPATAAVRPSSALVLTCGSEQTRSTDSSFGVQCYGPVTTDFRAWVECSKDGSTKFYGTYYAETPKSTGDPSPWSTANCSGSNNLVFGEGVQLKTV